MRLRHSETLARRQRCCGTILMKVWVPPTRGSLPRCSSETEPAMIKPPRREARFPPTPTSTRRGAASAVRVAGEAGNGAWVEARSPTDAAHEHKSTHAWRPPCAGPPTRPTSRLPNRLPPAGTAVGNSHPMRVYCDEWSASSGSRASRALHLVRTVQARCSTEGSVADSGSRPSEARRAIRQKCRCAMSSSL
jgi:hypothetical protein